MGGSLPAELEGIKGADLLIGVPIYNNAATLGRVMETLAAGIARNFPGARAVLIGSDGGSTDGSAEVFKRLANQNLPMFLVSHPVPPAHKIQIPYHGVPGKENALKLIFDTAQRLQVKGCLVVDASLNSMTPEWVPLLLRPIVEEGFDFLAPLYSRHPFEGTISSGILYPLHRALYGKIIRHPIAGDFGSSEKLIRYLLSQKIAESETARSGVELWITARTVAGDFKVGQSYLGPRIQTVEDGRADLGTIFGQAVFTAFRLMEDLQGEWRNSRGIQSVAAFGRPAEDPPAISFNLERMIANFRLGVRALMEIWRKILTPETARGVEILQQLSDERFGFPSELWVRVIYDFAAGFHREVVHRDHLLKSMVPLYLGWVASFFKENRGASASAVEEKIEGLCGHFEKQKPYLLERWEK
jgi:glucosylglycerate synthase